MKNQLFLVLIVVVVVGVFCDDTVVNTHVNPSENSDDVIENAIQMLNNGQTTDQGLNLLRIEAEKNNGVALYLLGSFYEIGKYVERNWNLALEFYNKSANTGNADAQAALGFMYGTGKGVSINNPLSLLYYAFAAHGGSLGAKMALGYKYMNGLSVTKSCDKAAAKYEEVAAAVVSELGVFQAPWYKEPKYLLDSWEGKDDDQMVDEDRVQLLQYNADSGDINSQVMLGMLHLQGIFGVQQDNRLAFEHFQHAANQNDPEGMANLGFMYVNGLGVEADNETALRLFKRAADKGNRMAQSHLGSMYANGYAVTKNIQDAIRYFKSAADQGHHEAQQNLAYIYYNGDEGVKRDYLKALAYFSLSAQQGNLWALYYLAEMHYFGYGTNPSCQLALSYYKRVAERGVWSNVLSAAHDYYLDGQVEKSLLKYELAAEWGYEIAQSNAAFIYDRILISSNFSEYHSNHEMAFRYYSNAAEQKNIVAHLRIGDYFYFGLGTEMDRKKAAEHYHAASEMRNAQATFNIAYMHQHGDGLPRDLHLAKRYYDATLSFQTDSALAVYLSYCSLAFDFMVDYFVQGTSPLGAHPSPHGSTFTQILSKISSVVAFDTILLGILVVLLLILVSIKMARR